jgi:hypothetical protein
VLHVATGFCWRRVSSHSEETGRRGRASSMTTASAATGGTGPGTVDPAVVTKQATYIGVGSNVVYCVGN